MAFSISNSSQSKILLQARFARRFLRRARQTVRFGRASIQNAPVFFANSFPKSGTHLLTQVLAGLCRIGPAVVSGLPAVVTYDGHSGRQREITEILNDLKRFLPGDIGYGHLHAFPEVAVHLYQEGVATFFILRDPRDVAISHVHYVTEMASEHIHHNYFRNDLKSFDERLRVSIVGADQAEIPAENGNISQIPLPDIRERLAPYIGWLSRPEVLSLRFESFITDRQAAVAQVFDYAVQRGYAPRARREEAIRILAHSIDPQRSPTFRSGKIGAWQDAFTPEHKREFKETCGDLLVQLGYEDDANW